MFLQSASVCDGAFDMKFTLDVGENHVILQQIKTN